MASRQFGLYFAWSRPKEIDVDLGVLENRYPTLWEFRRALWPLVEGLRSKSPQSIQGFLDHVILDDFQRFRTVVHDITGNDVPVVQREGDQPPTQHLDDDLLAHVDTLIIVSLDHFRTDQTATAGEIDMIRAFLSREGRTVVVCPHHNIGEETSGQRDAPTSKQKVEYKHHGDQLIPAQQRIGGFARTLLAGLGLPIENCFGLNPARAIDGSPADLVVAKDLDTDNILRGVTTFNLHPHLPHLHVPLALEAQVQVLAKQLINPAASAHPFVESGNRTFNAFLRSTPGVFAGNLFVGDATLWSSAFGGLNSLQNLWRNLAELK